MYWEKIVLVSGWRERVEWAKHKLIEVSAIRRLSKWKGERGLFKEGKRNLKALGS